MAKKRDFRDYMEKFSITSEDEVSFPICNDCKHLIIGSTRCVAYPNGIPDEIFNNTVDHTKPHTGDGGIIFEPRD